MRSRIAMMGWDYRVVVADGMINGLGYADIRRKLSEAGLPEDELPSDGSMRTYRDSRELQSMLADRIKAQKDHRDAARAADRVESLIDLATVRALEGLYDDLGEPETTIGERIKAVRVLTMYRRQLFLERQAGDVKPNVARHRVLESDLENPDHILFEAGSEAAPRSSESPERSAEPDAGDTWGYVPMNADGSGYVGVNGDRSGVTGEDEKTANKGDRDILNPENWVDLADTGLDGGVAVEMAVDGDEDEVLISVDEVRSLHDGELGYFARSAEFSSLLAELRELAPEEQVQWIQDRFPSDAETGARLLWTRILHYARQHAGAA